MTQKHVKRKTIIVHKPPKSVSTLVPVLYRDTERLDNGDLKVATAHKAQLDHVVYFLKSTGIIFAFVPTIKLLVSLYKFIGHRVAQNQGLKGLRTRALVHFGEASPDPATFQAFMALATKDMYVQVESVDEYLVAYKRSERLNQKIYSHPTLFKVQPWNFTIYNNYPISTSLYNTYSVILIRFPGQGQSVLERLTTFSQYVL
jgi:hypothetical protein